MTTFSYRIRAWLTIATLIVLPSFSLFSEDPISTDSDGGSGSDLAQTLQNPVADLISVPFQNNFDWGGGPNGDGFQFKVNIQPVIPINLNDDWNIVSRTIVPYVYQENIIGTSKQNGLSDTLQSTFFSPVSPTDSGWIWGAGPALLIPTATDNRLGTEKWALGPSAVALKQVGGWTFGGLATQLWDFAGDDARADVNETFLQPFVAYTTASKTTFSLNSESSYNWTADEWTIPINASVSQLTMVGKVPVQFQFGGRYYAESPIGGPEWGLRFGITLLFPE